MLTVTPDEHREEEREEEEREEAPPMMYERETIIEREEVPVYEPYPEDDW